MIKNLLAKLFGKYLEDKAGLYDGTPSEGKPWYRSKGILSGIAVFLRGLYELVSALMIQIGKPPLPPIPPFIDAILLSVLGAGAIKGRVEGSQPITIGSGVDPKDQAPS